MPRWDLLKHRGALSGIRMHRLSSGLIVYNWLDGARTVRTRHHQHNLRRELVRELRRWQVRWRLRIDRLRGMCEWLLLSDRGKRAAAVRGGQLQLSH